MFWVSAAIIILAVIMVVDGHRASVYAKANTEAMIAMRDVVKSLNERLVALEIEQPARTSVKEKDTDPALTWQAQRQRAEMGAN